MNAPFSPIKTAIVTGGKNGLGAYIVAALNQQVLIQASPYDIMDGNDVLRPTKEIIDWYNREGLDYLINNAALNHPAWLEDLTEENWDAVMDVNAKGIFMMVKALLPALEKKKGTIINIVSNAAHIPMRCSAHYNASKGAAHILTLQMARELFSKYGITVFGIAPNKLAGTLMSKEIEENVVKLRGWTPEHAKEYQLASIPCGAETPPERVAEFIAFLLSEKDRHRYLHGTILPYGI